MTDTQNRILDALDDAPDGWVSGLDAANRIYTGPLATIQLLATRLGMSDSAVRRSVHKLHARGLVLIIDALDPSSRKRRLYVTGVSA